MKKTETESRDYTLPDPKTIKNILKNYIQNEKALIDQLYFETSHGPTIGGFREDIWREMFEQIVPKKFVIEQSVFIIDSAAEFLMKWIWRFLMKPIRHTSFAMEG